MATIIFLTVSSLRELSFLPVPTAVVAVWFSEGKHMRGLRRRQNNVVSSPHEVFGKK
jgi:hypothetical protein